MATVTLAWIGIVLLWEPAYVVLSQDDAFYYTTIAARWSAGEGPTFDGVTETNGFHPLWEVVLVTIARVVGPGPDVLMRVGWVLSIATVAVSVASADRKLGLGGRLASVVAVSWLNPYVLALTVNGMESALAAALWWLLLGAIATGARAARLGWIAGMLVLARLDSALGLALIALAVGGPDLPWRRMGVAAAVAAAVVAPWVAYACWEFGTLVPVSAHAYAAPGDAYRLGALAAALLAAVGVGRRLTRDVLDRAALALAAFAVFEAIAGVVRFHFPPPWYLAPSFVALSLSVARSSWSSVARRVVATAVVALAVACASYRFSPDSYAHKLAARATGRWIAQHLPRDARIGSWDAGVIAAHAMRRVTHLEGAVGPIASSPRDPLTEVEAIDYVAQRFPRDWLCGSSNLRVGGASLGAWVVRRAVEVDSRTVLARGRMRRQVFLVLARTGPDETLAHHRARTCRGDR